LTGKRDAREVMRLLTIEEAAAYTALSTRTIRRRIRDGDLHAYRVGPRSIRVRPDDLENLLRPIPNARSWR
jgi:excisionase family DNA binding protein